MVARQLLYTMLCSVQTGNMSQPKITEVKEFEIDPRRGPKTREAQQEEEAKKASETSQPIPGEDKLSPWKFPRKED